MKPAVHQVLATLGHGDAIGNEVLGIRRVLRAAGYDSEIFVETADPRLEHLTGDYRGLMASSAPDNVLIHHFSIGSRISRIAYALPDRMILVYHNITPPEFFLGVHPVLVRQCFSARRELPAFARRAGLALGDSEFNRRELEAMGFPETDVLPVVPDFSHLETPPEPPIGDVLDDSLTNVLFVGRFMPNKRIEDVIRIFHAYQLLFNARSRLLLVGSYTHFERYQAMLQELVSRLGTAGVHFLGHVSNAELAAYYEMADVFLSASEHEGFCVPIIESFRQGVPVVAFAATAVPATMDGAGVLYTVKDPAVVAAMVHEVASNEGARARVVEGQVAALGRLLAKDFGGTLLGFVDRVARAPRRQAPEVRPGFWDEVTRAERSEQLRRFRSDVFWAPPAAS
jgi:L-malate glycosyltransferase